ncbi:MAG: glycoside hydrolase family 99-like domain-containing protein [Armatimonadetes bacterium]|nr:glycoside hydrolase family 99-like domain-containing protein [Armatimonadota bacterium]
MKTLLVAALSALLVAPVNAQTPTGKSAAKRPQLLAHYMPWFDADLDAKRYGWHWTMNKRDPNKQDANGRRKIAAHDSPLIGVYDSGDPDVLEYHVLLMKIAGIDGVIADWYGDTDYLDYALVHRNTAALLAWAKKAGLSFAVCYEDQTVPKLVAGGKVAKEETTAYGQGILSRLERSWFADSAYLRLHGKPVFLVFGYAFYKSEDWAAILAPPLKPVAYFSQDTRREPATGAFAWVNPRPEGAANADRFYVASKGEGAFMPVAYPSFHDYYKEAGVGESYGRIDSANGKTLRETLSRAAKSRPPFIQIATWNDWGEGTSIEPGDAMKDAYLQIVQEFRRKQDKSFAYRPADLSLPRQLFALRKKHRKNAAVQQKLNTAFQYICGGKTAAAKAALLAIKP